MLFLALMAASVAFGFFAMRGVRVVGLPIDVEVALTMVALLGASILGAFVERARRRAA